MSCNSNCGCGSSGSNCGCSDSESTNSGLKKETFEAQMYPSYLHNQSKGVGCESNKGKFYDLTTEPFTFPALGMEGYLRVCDGSLWKAGQFIAITTGPSSIAAMRITEVGSQRLKVLNGCDRSGDNGIFGNPDPGTVIPVKSLIYAIPPTGCDSDLANRIINTLEQSGVETIINILAEAEDICFTSLKDLGDNEEGHLFVGTMPDCECAPDSLFSSCFKKIKRIFTGQGGKTLCMPDVATVDLIDVQKRIAIFDDSGCLKKGPTYSDLKSCDNQESFLKDVPFDAVNGCNDGISLGLSPNADHLQITSMKFDDPNSDDSANKVTRWVSTEKKYAVLTHTTASGIDAPAGPVGIWNIRTINTIRNQYPASFVTLSNNEITINKPGLYEIKWNSVFWATNDAQSRLENAVDIAEAYLGLAIYARNVSGDANHSIDAGTAFVEVKEGEPKKYRLMYRVESTGTNRLGISNPFGLNNYALITIKSI
jgi:hypothetical protein